MKDEIWRDVIGYEGLYEVSNYGRVRSLNYKRTGEMRVMKQGKHTRGYLMVILSKDGKLKGYVVHRLVAEAFIPNPLGLPQVNHINEDKTNNCVENLEWCDARYNINYGTRNEQISKRVYQYANSGSFVRSYCSTQEASRVTGVKQSNISACCNNKPKRKSAGNYRWSFDPPTPTTSRTLF